MNCKDIVDYVSAYLEGRLSPHERARFDQHLALCPPCEVYVDQMRQTIRALGALSEETLSEETKVNLLLAFRDWTIAKPAAPPAVDQE